MIFPPSGKLEALCRQGFWNWVWSLLSLKLKLISWWTWSLASLVRKRLHGFYSIYLHGTVPKPTVHSGSVLQIRAFPCWQYYKTFFLWKSRFLPNFKNALKTFMNCLNRNFVHFRWVNEHSKALLWDLNCFRTVFWDLKFRKKFQLPDFLPTMSVMF